MAAASPATKGPELLRSTGDLAADSERYLDPSSFEIRRLQQEIAKLARASAVEAQLCRIYLASACGDWEEAKRLAANVRNLHYETHADVFEMISALNIGYFSSAAALYPGLASLRSGELSETLPTGIICACFDDLLRAAEEAKAASIDLSELGQTAVGIAMSATSVLHRLAVNETDVRAMLDIAGEVLREHSLFWQDRMPAVRVLDDSDGAGLLYEFRVAVDAELACEMTDQVLERLIERELDRPGLTFSFRSTPATAGGSA